MVYHIIISKLSFKNMNTPFQGIHEKKTAVSNSVGNLELDYKRT